jgi:signal transduction histidine kinase
MRFLNQFISRIPYWAYLLVVLVVVVNIIYLGNLYRLRFIDVDYKFEEGKCIISEKSAWGPTTRAGLKAGDIVLSIDSIPISGLEQLFSILNNHVIGDTLTYVVSRNNNVYALTRIISSYMQEAPALYYIKFLLMMLFSIACLYVLYKKPGDRTAVIFFIYSQICSVFHIAYFLPWPNLFTNFANILLYYSGFLSGPVLIHFILLFPQPSIIYRKIRWLLVLFYGTGFLIASLLVIFYMLSIYHPSGEFYLKLLNDINRIIVSWILFSFCVSMAGAVYQFRTIKNTVARNQLRMVIIGSFFGYSVPMAYAVFYHYLFHLNFLYPFIFYDLAQGVTIIIMIICFLIALFRYRIWNIELYIKKAVLYLVATLVITLTYFLLIFLVSQLTEGESDIIRFVALAVSVIIFLMLRDTLQQLINRFFHREAYDSATVVADFEEKLAGIYRIDELKSGISKGLDDIFHFKSLVFNLKKEELTYVPAYSLGQVQPLVEKEYNITPEMEQRLQKSRVFSPAELDQKSSVPEMANGELVIPLLKENKPFGFFLCGPKKSELTYSMQDIRVLSLIAKRVIALFNTAGLYQKDLDRQLMLERERARISQDMHDDVGASLTRISILSDLAKNKTEITDDTKQWLGQISDTSRGVMEEMNQIIWALNPKNDTLEGLVAYLRRFVYEYLEPTTVNCVFDLPETLPDKALNVEVRRNVYLVVREAMHNVIKHAGASKVFVSMRMNEHGFRVKIKDNGKGFDPTSPEFPGNGLINMKKRMNDIEGEFLIKSKTGEGTVIELIVPLK